MEHSPILRSIIPSATQDILLSFKNPKVHYVFKTANILLVPLFRELVVVVSDRLCGLVVRVSGYKSRGPGFDSRPYQIF
jgi:hypothetical protein